MALDKQIQIHSLDTSNFYSKRELYLHNLINKVKSEKKQVRKKIEYYENILCDNYSYSSSQLKDILKEDYEFSNDKDISINEYYYREYKKAYCIINKKITNTKDKLLLLLNNKAEQNDISNGQHHIRILKPQTITEENIISVFDSFLIRTLGIQENAFTNDFMVIQTYYFDIIRDLICNGFMYKGEKYIYYTSSAGQIRQKKTVFIKESVWNRYEKTLMCGLTIDTINAKGGNNPNKHLAYLALTNSATDLWEEFDIDKSIVIDDFETDVFGTYDLIDDTDYSIKRVSDNVPIPHTDGVGMILPKLSRKNFMVRLSWIKGLLGVFDFVEFIKQNNCSPIIKDIYGVEHNIIDEDIQVIFTKSQFKMH